MALLLLNEFWLTLDRRAAHACREIVARNWRGESDWYTHIQSALCQVINGPSVHLLSYPTLICPTVLHPLPRETNCAFADDRPIVMKNILYLAPDPAQVQVTFTGTG